MNRLSRIGTSGLVLALALLLPQGALALTLAELDAGASFSTTDGSLAFQNFSVMLPDRVDGSPNAFAGVDLSIFEVEVFTDSFGFKVLEFDTPLAAVGTQIGNMLITFDVVADPLTLIEAVGLAMTATAAGPGASTSIAETIVGANSGTTELLAIREAGGVEQPIDSAVLGMAETSLWITKEITIDVRDATAVFAQISEFDTDVRDLADPRARCRLALRLWSARAGPGTTAPPGLARTCRQPAAGSSAKGSSASRGALVQ